MWQEGIQVLSFFKKKKLDEKSTRQRRCVLILLDQNAMPMVAHNLGFWHQHHSPWPPNWAYSLGRVLWLCNFGLVCPILILKGPSSQRITYYKAHSYSNFLKSQLRRSYSNIKILYCIFFFLAVTSHFSLL